MGDSLGTPGLKIEGENAELVTKPTCADSPLGLNNPDDLMRERGLDPEEWEITSMIINEWDAATGQIDLEAKTVQKLRQLKICLKRKRPVTLITPARTSGKFYIAKPRREYGDGPKRVVFVGDQQAPYHDECLHERFCDFLKDYQPDEGVLIGDTIDLPDVSRHPPNPEHDSSAQECVDSGYLVCQGYREAFPPTRWKKLAGNHDERLRRAQIDRLRETYGIRRALIPGQEPEEPVLDVAHLLRLDELGIEYVNPNGDYEHAQVNVSPHLAARHGWIARKGSGASALATLEHLGYSVVVGHTHRQSLVHKTRHDINGSLATLAACETGCMCRIEGGLGYTPSPDWQNGFATAEVWPDGTFKLDVATFVDEVLYYRDRRY